MGHDDVPRVRTAAARLQGSRVMAGGADRKLAAIMFTDMVGFSAVTQRDEALALDLLAEHQRRLRPIFAQHGAAEKGGSGAVTERSVLHE